MKVVKITLFLLPVCFAFLGTVVLFHDTFLPWIIIILSLLSEMKNTTMVKSGDQLQIVIPNVDEINILDVDIAGPQNMYPKVKISRMKFLALGST